MSSERPAKRTCVTPFLVEKEKEKVSFCFDGPEMRAPSVIHLESTDVYDLEVNATWSVRASALSAADVAKHLADLTCEPNKDKAARQGKAAPKTFPIGAVLAGRLVMPPWYAKLAFPNAPHARVLLTRGEAMREGVTFGGTLRSHPPQQQAAARYLEWIAANMPCTSCIVTLPCGYGKTVWLLAMAAALGRVTLVLAHTIALVDQWIEEARQFLPGVRVGYIKDGTSRVDGVDIIIASVQSLRSHITGKQAYIPTLLARVGTLCMDEGHHAVASTFWEVMSQVPALYRFVLTATPRRKDGLLPQLQWITGPVIFRAFRQVDDVHAVCVEYMSEAHVEIKRYKMLDNASMVTALCEDDLRSSIAVELAVHLVRTQNRRIVIVTPRVEHIHRLADMLTPRLAEFCEPREVDMFVHDKCKIRKTKLKSETPEQSLERFTAAKVAWEDSGPHGHVERVKAPLVGKVLAGMDTMDRETQYEGVVVIASPGIMEEGVSYKQWDTLLDLNNSSDAEQVVGRVLRECPTKKVPLIIDVWIALSLFNGLFWKRHGYYRDEEFSRRSIQVRVPGDVVPALDWEKYNRFCEEVKR
jgi:hypothetical protein